MRRTIAIPLFLVFALLASDAFAQNKPTTEFSFSTAKSKLTVMYADRPVTFYCGCVYTPNPTGTSGKVDAGTCGYQVRVNFARGARTEWEHIVPAHRFGGHRQCWTTGHTKCKTSSGTAFKGRKCCAKKGVDTEFRSMEADLHNLVPAIGELNADRSNFAFGDVAGEERKYGACNFEVDSAAKTAEPPEDRRGEIARAYLYMHTVWGMALDAAEKTRLEAWHADDPPSGWEVVRDWRIEEIQGNKNSLVRP